MEYPLDPERIPVDEDGVEAFFWPLTREEVLGVRDRLCRTVASCSRDSMALQVVSKHFCLEALSLHRAFTLSERMRARGYTPVANGSRFFPTVARGEQPARPAWLGQLSAGPPPSSRLYRHMLEASWNGLVHDPFRRGWDDDDVVAIPGSNLLTRHARIDRRTIRCGKHTWWFDAVGDVESERTGPRDPLDACLEGIDEVFDAVGAPLPGFLADYLRTLMEESIALVSVHLGRLTDEATLPRELWTASGGNLWTRMLREATRATGGTVVGHDHAYGAGFDRDHGMELIDFVACDEFVTHTRTQARNLRRYTDEQLVPSDRLPDISSLPSIENPSRVHVPPRLATRVRSRIANRLASWPDDIQSVMYVSTVYQVDQSRFTDALPGPVLLDWQARLFHHLRERWGLDVLMKPHPGGEGRPPDSLLDQFDVELVSRPFEVTVHRPDAFLFDFPRTTTLGSAITVDKPVILVDFGHADWVPSARELLGRRCSIVDGRLDEENRARVDWEELRTAIDAATDLRDDGFVSAYYTGSEDDR